jgi:cell division protein FtsW (lipid II flippase)
MLDCTQDPKREEMDERTLSLILKVEVAADLALIVIGLFLLLLTGIEVLIPIALVGAGFAGLVIAVVLYRVHGTKPGRSRQ